MKVDYWYAAAPGGAAEAARDAEAMGFDGFFSAEAQFDPFLPLALAANTSTHLELGTGIAVAFARSPMITAMVSWDLARMSRGKFLLGLGTQVRGHIVRRFSSPWDKPVARLRDYIMALRAIWDCWQNATPLEYEGEFYQFSLMTPFFNPGPIPDPDIPVLIAGVGPGLSRLAGQICQGFHVHPFHTTRYLDDVVLPALEAGAKEGGRELADVERVTTSFIMTGETDSDIEQAMEAVRQQISFYASTPSYTPMMEANGWDFGPELRAMSKRGEWAAMPALVPDEAVLEVGVAAPIDRLGAAITERYEDRIQRIGFYTIGSVLGIDPDATRQVLADIRNARPGTR